MSRRPKGMYRDLRDLPKRSDWGLKGFRMERQPKRERRHWKLERQRWKQPRQQQREREAKIL